MKAFIIFAMVFVALSLEVESKIFNRCELVRELRRQGFPEGDLSNWVRLVEAESSSNTAQVGPVNKDRSRDYGLFQINDKYCSNTDTPGKDCNVTCNDLLTEDITKASTCAKKVFKRHGFRAWYDGRNSRQGQAVRALPIIDYC